MQDRNFAASVLATIGVHEADAVSAPIHGLLTRVAIAVCCAETGATPAPAPNIDGWDVRIAPLEFVAYNTVLPGYAPLFLPRDMSQPAAQALVSICLPGGAAAYGWRFRGPDDAPDPRAHLMPAYARKLYPSGNRRILVITDGPLVNWVFGGPALTTVALQSLESWCRDKYGHALMDAAFGHVYVEPNPVDADLGERLSVVQCTRSYAGFDLGSNATLWQPGEPHPGIGVVSWPKISLDEKPIQFNGAVVDALGALQAAGAADGDPLPGRVHAEPVINEKFQLVILAWGVRRARFSCTCTLGIVLAWIVDVDNRQEKRLREFADAWLHRLAGGLHGIYGAADRDDSDLLLISFRNSFGYSDAAVFALPDFNLRDVAPVLAGVHLVNVKYGVQSWFTPENRCNLLRHYVFKMHIAHVISMAGDNIWPDLVTLGGYQHFDLVVKLSSKLQPLTYLESGNRRLLASPNWQILESVGCLKDTDGHTAYYGYDIPGTWEVSDGCAVRLNSSTTSIPATDAAIRYAWMHRERIDVISLQREDFVVVCDLDGYYAPLSFAPVAKSESRSIVGVELSSGGRLFHGHNPQC